MRAEDIGAPVSYFHDRPPVDALISLRKAGIRKVEFGGEALKSLSPEELSELCRLMRDEGMICASVSAVRDLIPVTLGNLVSMQRAERERAVFHVQRCIELAAILGSSYVICDFGSSTENLAELREQNQIFFDSLQTILRSAALAPIDIVVQNVPGRRWIAWEGLPPDPARVVERHVWPWRMWSDEESLIEATELHFGKKILWAFDTANEFVAQGIHSFDLAKSIQRYPADRLAMIYLANHPGPYNEVWHRSLLHQALDDGRYTSSDFLSLKSGLEAAGFRGSYMLQIAEKQPTIESLRKNMQFAEGLL